MKYVTLWSGGLDSTYLIQHLLEEGHIVRSYYVEIMNNENKTENENKAIQKLLEADFFKNKNFQFWGKITRVDLIRSAHVTMLPQSAFLLDGLSYGAKKTDFDFAALGYVKNDDAISWLPELKKYWNSRATLFESGLSELTFPLSQFGKEEILEHMDKELKKDVFWCEDMDIKYPNYCGKCNPCRKMISYGKNDPCNVEPGVLSCF